MFSDSNKKAYFFIALYSVIYFCIRYFQNGTIEGDEIKQLLQAREFIACDGLQAPLYLWILHTVNNIFGFHLENVLILRYLLLFAFNLIFYFCMKKLVPPKYAFIATVSLAFFPVYSFIMSVHYTHTLLVSVFSVSAFLVFLKLLEERSILNYSLLGLFFALGLLSKYNFVFLPIVLVLASLSDKRGREILFNKKTFIALGVFFVVISPHIFYLLGGATDSLVYALDRGHSGDLNIFDLGTFLKLVSNYAIQFLIYLVVFLLFFFRQLSFKVENKIFYFMSLYSFVLPLVVIIVAKLERFTVSWVAPLYFLLVVALFTLLDFSRISEKRWNLYFSAGILVLLVFLSIRLLTFFAPDIMGEPHRVHVPAKALAQELKTKLGDFLNSEDLTVLYYERRLLKNILLTINTEARMLDFEEFTKLKEKPHTPILVLIDAKRFGADVESKFKEELPLLDDFKYISKNYNYSKKAFKMGYSIIPSSND